MRNYARFIPHEEIDSAEPWEFGAVDTVAATMAVKQAEQVKAIESAIDLARDESIKQTGYAEGFAQGHAKATLEAQKTIDDAIAEQAHKAAQDFAKLFESVQTQLGESQQVMSGSVLELACALARQVLRQELSINPNVLQPVVREALDLLVGESKEALIRLNPLDLEVLEEVLRTEFSNLTLNLLADPAVTRGGCIVESAGTVVDGTLEKRWLRAIGTLGQTFDWEAPVADQ